MQIIPEPQSFFRRMNARRKSLGYRICKTLKPIIYVLKVAVLAMAAVALFLHLSKQRAPEKKEEARYMTIPVSTPEQQVVIRIPNENGSHVPKKRHMQTPTPVSYPPAPPPVLEPVKKADETSTVKDVLDLRIVQTTKTATAKSVETTKALPMNHPFPVSKPEVVNDGSDEFAEIVIRTTGIYRSVVSEIDSMTEAVSVRIASAIEYGSAFGASDDDQPKKPTKKRSRRRRH